MNGVTGRMGANQHVARSIAAIRADGGLDAGGLTVWPDPILVGRDEGKLRDLAGQYGIERYSTDLSACLADPADSVYFDAQPTGRREAALRSAIAAGKHVYCEKPTAMTSAGGLELADLAEAAGVKNGAVQDKLFLPGLLKLAGVLRSGALGRILSVRIDWGYWVFPDILGVTQRPSWNYRCEDGGGVVLDMFCHFRYILDRLFGDVRTVLCRTAVHIPERMDEEGSLFSATADDAAYGLCELEGGVIVQVNVSWCARTYRDDIARIQVDGTHGSAIAGSVRCHVQPEFATPAFARGPDILLQSDPRGGWLEVPDHRPPMNAFRRQWELFLRHVAIDEGFPWSLRDSARGVQLAELALVSAGERRWVDVPELSAARN